MQNNHQNEKNDRKSKALLLGVGLDNKDGHTRITKGDNFYLAGGSEETHGRMAETAIKVNEKLTTRGKELSDLSKDEFVDILMESAQ